MPNLKTIHDKHYQKDGGASFIPFTVDIDDDRSFTDLPTGKWVPDIRKGSLYVTICETCGYVEATCIHTTNKWFNANNTPYIEDRAASAEDRVKALHQDTKLICQLCGLDVT